MMARSSESRSATWGFSHRLEYRVIERCPCCCFTGCCCSAPAAVPAAAFHQGKYMAATNRAPRRGSCAPGATESCLLALFHEIDSDASGCLSIAELCQALQTNGELARLATGAKESRPLAPIAAGLIAQNIQHLADTEFALSDGDGTVSPEEFVSLIQRLMAERDRPASSSKGSATARGGAATAGSSATSARPRTSSSRQWTSTSASFAAFGKASRHASFAARRYSPV